MEAPVNVDGVSGIAAFFRIRDTVENRDSLRSALVEFHGKRLLTLSESTKALKLLGKESRKKSFHNSDELFWRTLRK